MRIVVTGSTGFIGRHLVRWLSQNPLYKLVLPVRRPLDAGHSCVASTVVVADMSSTTNWKALLQPDDVVIHLAGMAHKKLTAPNAHDIFYACNVTPLEALAYAAKEQGVSQLIFISSVGVYGSSSNAVVTNDSELRPDYPYSVSKLEAEQQLLAIAAGQLNVKILRIPLVYGCDAPGNFGSLLRLVQSRLPLPFGRVVSKKSFLSIESLVEIIERLITLQTTSPAIFVAADKEPVQLNDLIQDLATGMGHSAINLPIPVFILKWGLRLLGKKDLYEKLCGPLEVDSSELYQLLAWQPEHKTSDLLKQTAADFAGAKHK